MKAIANLSIAAKFFIVVAILALATGLVTAQATLALRTYDHQVELIQRASQRAVIGERTNGLVLSTVMDSRGVYMSRDIAEAAKFAKPMLGTLKQMEAQLVEWRALVEPGDIEQFERVERVGRDFIKFRA